MITNWEEESLKLIDSIFYVHKNTTDNTVVNSVQFSIVHRSTGYRHPRPDLNPRPVHVLICFCVACAAWLHTRHASGGTSHDKDQDSQTEALLVSAGDVTARSHFLPDVRYGGQHGSFQGQENLRPYLKLAVLWVVEGFGKTAANLRATSGFELYTRHARYQ